MSAILQGTPHADGYRLPGEFERHDACWMLWPERPDNWRDGGKPAQAAFAAVAGAVAAFEHVTVGVSAAQYRNARLSLPSAVRLVELSSDDAWMRDVAPAFVTDGRGGVRGVRFGFNAWGGIKDGLYAPWDRDARVAATLLELERLDRYDAPLVLEGGAIACDGQGTLITTAGCLVNDNRNPGLGRGDVEAVLRDYLGVEAIIWLEHGLPGDETGGHIDNLVAFARPGVLALAWTDDPADPFYPVAREAMETLRGARDARGRAFDIQRIHQPPPMAMSTDESAGIDRIEGTKPRRAGDALCASYVNAYLGNGVAVIPAFDEAMDERARNAYAALHPERLIVQIPAREIVLGGGGIHCITHEQPSPQGTPPRFTRRHR